MIALWIAVIILSCWSLVLTIACLRLGRNRAGVSDIYALGAHVDAYAKRAHRELKRHDDILVEHDKQLTALNDQRLVGGGS